MFFNYFLFSCLVSVSVGLVSVSGLCAVVDGNGFRFSVGLVSG